MSAGHNGRGTPDEGDDDPFAYLYRPEGGQAQGQPRPAPRQPSYNQVRPVGERTFGGQQGYRQPPAQQPQHRPDAYYAAPETQAGGVPPQGGPPGRRRTDQEPRRNGLLIGAIAVVVAVVLGIGAAILLSGDDDESPGADGGATPTGPGEEDGGGGDDEPTEEPTDEATEPEGLPAAELADLQLGNGAALASDVQGARSADGQYISIQGKPDSSVTWTFDFTGEPGTYRLYTGYATITDGQSMAFSVNGTPRNDPVDMQDYATASDEWDTSWVSTYNLVELNEGQNTVQMTCTGPCDVVIDQLSITENRDQ
ncbi:hypothetical protein [Streptomyces sp. MP131-18]|uniref:hypothetical protein n=1 Tax=Streptomyces sp. MP131-18 TaxID=1857892 RepID=UPI00097CB481|nr:hypothetical protein [Streptomyces sp. MP131-18]ONK13518.1 hypothetical protein STBA_42870 [Streptomyces sp. MP131-18]